DRRRRHRGELHRHRNDDVARRVPPTRFSGDGLVTRRNLGGFNACLPLPRRFLVRVGRGLGPLRHARRGVGWRRVARHRPRRRESGGDAVAVSAAVRCHRWHRCGQLLRSLIAATTNWFTRHRSLAVALVSLGLAIGTFTVAPLATWLIVEHGWRTAMLALGGIAWLVVVPAALLLRPPPALPDDARALAEAGAGLRGPQTPPTPPVSAIAFTYFACCAAHSGPIFHMVSYAMLCGAPPLAATTVFSMAGLGSLCGRIVSGLLADRIGAKQVLMAGLAVQALAIVLYNFVH